MRTSRFGLDFLFIYADAGISPLPAAKFLPPLGPVEIAAFLCANGFSCRVIDARHRSFSIEWLSAYVSSVKPRWVGLSVFTDTLYTVNRLARIVRCASPSTRIAVGGPHATLCDDETMSVVGADCVVRGEGEIACLDILTKKNLKDVSGITFRQGKKLVRNDALPPVDLSKLPSPDFNLIEGISELPYSPAISTSRGCPYRCTFCAAGMLSPKVRWRPIGKVIEDATLALKQLGGKFLSIVDDTFTLSAERTALFCKAMAGIGGGDNIFWYAEGRVDRLATNPFLVAMMRKAGLAVLQLGIESGDTKVLKAYNKKIDLDDALSLAKICASEGVLIHAGFITGGPFESKETIAKTRDFALRLIEAAGGFLHAQFAYLTPLPGTTIYMHPERYGIDLLDPHLFSSISFDNCVTQTQALSRQEIMSMGGRISGEASAAAFNMVKKMKGDAKRQITKLSEELGPIHMSLVFHKEAYRKKEDLRSYFEGLIKRIYNKAKQYPQFMQKSEKMRNEELIPARLPMFAVDKYGRYSLPILNVEMNKSESDLFHYASGKLTAADIGVILGRGGKKIREDLKSIEDKQAIIYRTY